MLDRMKHELTLILFACAFATSAQSECCLDGTVWDNELGGCIPEVVACEVVSDLDGEGAVGAGDLIEFLSEFGYTISDADGDGVCDQIGIEGVRLLSCWVHIQRGLAVPTSRFVRYWWT